MKLLLAGGVNAHISKDHPDYNKYGYGNYFLLQIKEQVDAMIGDGKLVAICTAAKPDKHYLDEVLSELGFMIDDLIILGREDSAEWCKYHAILMTGGETRELHSWLKRTDFALDKLTSCELLGGESAGAYVLTRKLLLDYQPDGSSYEIADGFLPDVNILVAAHVNNPYYHQDSLTVVLKQWCKANKIKYLGLEENEITYIDLSDTDKQ